MEPSFRSLTKGRHRAWLRKKTSFTFPNANRKILIAYPIPFWEEDIGRVNQATRNSGCRISGYQEINKTGDQNL
jgi:hypothetical protein